VLCQAGLTLIPDLIEHQPVPWSPPDERQLQLTTQLRKRDRLLEVCQCFNESELAALAGWHPAVSLCQCERPPTETKHGRETEPHQTTHTAKAAHIHRLMMT